MISPVYGISRFWRSVGTKVSAEDSSSCDGPRGPCSQTLWSIDARRYSSVLQRLQRERFGCSSESRSERIPVACAGSVNRTHISLGHVVTERRAVSDKLQGNEESNRRQQSLIYARSTMIPISLLIVITMHRTSLSLSSLGHCCYSGRIKASEFRYSFLTVSEEYNDNISLPKQQLPTYHAYHSASAFSTWPYWTGISIQIRAPLLCQWIRYG